MKIILKEDLEKLGKAGDVVQVKDGYARNFLVPRNLAVVATKGSLASIEKILKEKQLRENKRKKEALALKDKVEGISCTAEVLVGEEDKVFGSVTAIEISRMLKDKGFFIDKRSIEMEEPIKALGVFSVPVRLHPEVTASLKLWVVKKEEKK
ncbi:MAG: 50S ribosomal protein L9 [candidate division Zixibacteria bacterium RBG_16_50_21]|nr:MAG: 50S ribosomal protein L9 [candidate division Zixibacteria bacterium RBG_16_50_21]